MSDDERTRHYLRVGRAGGCFNAAASTRVASRDGIAPGYRSFSLGFRLVISAEA